LKSYSSKRREKSIGVSQLNGYENGNRLLGQSGREKTNGKKQQEAKVISELIGARAYPSVWTVIPSHTQ